MSTLPVESASASASGEFFV